MTPALTASVAMAVFDVAQRLLVVVSVLFVLVFVAVLVRRISGSAVERRVTARADALRPLMLKILADEEDDPATVRRLAELPERQWRSIEPSLVDMLGKVRGTAREALVAVLDERGTLTRADRRTRSWSAVDRCRGAEALGAARHRPAVQRLGELLEDRSPEVRRVAARSLGRIGDPDAVTPLLGAALGSRALPVRDIATALTLLEADATAAIIGNAGRAGSAVDPRVRAIAAEVLGLRGAVESTTLLTAALLGDDSLEVRIRAARALGRLGVRSASGPLMAAIESDSGELRAVACRALGQLGALEAIPRLVGCLADPSHRVAGNAAEALASLGPRGVDALSRVRAGADARAAGYAGEALELYQLGRRTLERKGA